MVFSKIVCVTESLKINFYIDLNECKVLKENSSEMSVFKEDISKVIKIFNIDNTKESLIGCIEQAYILMSDLVVNFITTSLLYIDNRCKYMIFEREYYFRDVKGLIQNNSLFRSDICNLLFSLCDIMMILSEYDLMISNLKSSNIIIDINNKIKICDLFLSKLRQDDNMRLYDICFKSPEELNGLEYNERSVIWSIGCILYEMMFKKLPFYEDDNMNKTKDNILRCKYIIDVECDEMMKEMIFRMLKVKNEDRLSLKELRKEVIKMSEILKDDENNLMICEEKKEALYNNDYLIEISPYVVKEEYYVERDKWKNIRDELMESYNNMHNERILLLLLMMKLSKKDYSIEEKLKFQIHHTCKEHGGCKLDEMLFNINTDERKKEIVSINSKCICLCEEGMKYFFQVFKLIKLLQLSFDEVGIPFQYQSLFGSYIYQLLNIQEINLANTNLTIRFIESFTKSIPNIKLKYIDLHFNPIGPKGFKLLLPYLHLLINKDNELDIRGMNLIDESMILLSEELYKYPILDSINITSNRRIHFAGLKVLFSKFPISKVEFDFNRCKELLIDKDIPEIIKYIYNEYYGILELKNLEIDDEIFIQFISLRLNESQGIRKLDLRNNKLTYKSVEILINNLSSYQCLEKLLIYGNEIGDEGMRIISPHLKLIVGDDYDDYVINCSKMGLSSVGLNYLIDGLKNINVSIKVDISDNNIDSIGIVYLMDYVTMNDIIFQLSIENNPIGNNGFKILIENIKILKKLTGEINLCYTSIDDESIILLENKLNVIKECKTIILNGNEVSINGMISICTKSLRKKVYPFIQMKCSSFSNEELVYYLEYCSKKRRNGSDRCYDFSNMNINDSHISLINQIYYCRIDLSNNRITSKGLKELMDCFPKDKTKIISIYNNNEIGNEGIEIICKYFHKVVDDYDSLNLSNIGMSEEGLKMLIERLKDYKLLEKINISGNELNEEELILMKENQEVFDSLDELSITVKENIDKSELKSFFEIFSTIGIIKIDGISKEEKKELSKEFFNIE